MTQPANRNSPGLIAKEPLITTATVTALVISVCALLRVFGVPIQPDVQDAVVGVVGAAGVLISAFISRGYVTPLAIPRTSTGRPLVPAGTVAGGGAVGGASGDWR